MREVAGVTGGEAQVVMQCRGSDQAVNCRDAATHFDAQTRPAFGNCRANGYEAIGKALNDIAIQPHAQ